MAKNYKSENYGVNKYSEGFVYKSVTGDYEITLEQFLKENPGMSEKDFLYWKSISDELYHEESVRMTAIKRKEVPLEEIQDTLMVSIPSAEDEFLRIETNIDENKLTEEKIKDPAFILEIAKAILPGIHLNRFIAFYYENKKIKDIAAAEYVHRTTVSHSIKKAEKKIRGYLTRLCKENEITIFD
jgi:predicted DNA-binding protein YlxM (UPF0122 family)